LAFGALAFAGFRVRAGSAFAASPLGAALRVLLPGPFAARASIRVMASSSAPPSGRSRSQRSVGLAVADIGDHSALQNLDRRAGFAGGPQSFNASGPAPHRAFASRSAISVTAC